MKLHIDGYLTKQIPGYFTISSLPEILSLPSLSLTAGDINNDNQLDILDYSILLSCFGSKFTSSICISKEADITDDGAVTGEDYNLFLREISVQK